MELGRRRTFSIAPITAPSEKLGEIARARAGNGGPDPEWIGLALVEPQEWGGRVVSVLARDQMDQMEGAPAPINVVVSNWIEQAQAIYRVVRFGRIIRGEICERCYDRVAHFRGVKLQPGAAPEDGYEIAVCERCEVVR